MQRPRLSLVSPTRRNQQPGKGGKPAAKKAAAKAKSRPGANLSGAMTMLCTAEATSSWFDGGKFTARPFGKLAQVPITLKGTPQYLVSVDANRDGRADLLVFQDLEQPPVLVISQADGSLKVVTTSGGIQLGDITPGQLFIGRLERQSIR